MTEENKEPLNNLKDNSLDDLVNDKTVVVDERIVIKKNIIVEEVVEATEAIIPDRVEIRPIEDRVRFHGHPTAKLDRPKKIRVLPNMTTMKYDIDLTAKDLDWLESRLGFRVSLEYTPGVYNDAWDSNKFILKLTNETKVLLPKINPYDFIFYKSALKDGWVANSWDEWERQDAYEAKYYIYDQHEQSRKKSSKLELLTAARKVSYELSRHQKEQILLVINEVDYSTVSSNIIDVEIDEIINVDPMKFIEFAKMDKGQLFLRAICIEAISTRVITKRTEGYYYRDMFLGTDVSEIVRYLSNPSNQGIKIAILEGVQKMK